MFTSIVVVLLVTFVPFLVEKVKGIPQEIIMFIVPRLNELNFHMYFSF